MLLVRFMHFLMPSQTRPHLFSAFWLAGENGSGKTNTLDAICFALGDKVSNLRVDSPDKLFNEGILHHAGIISNVLYNILINIDPLQIIVQIGILHHAGRSISVKLVFTFVNGSKETIAEIVTSQSKAKKGITLNGQ